MDVGGVLGEAWSLYKRFLGRFFMTAIAVFVVLDLLSALADRAAGDSVGADVFWTLVAALIGVIGYFWFRPRSWRPLTTCATGAPTARSAGPTAPVGHAWRRRPSRACWR